MQHNVFCHPHEDKPVFHTEEEAEDYIRTKYYGRNMGVYVCPVKRDHYHVRDNAKRNSKRRREQKGRQLQKYTSQSEGYTEPNYWDFLSGETEG
jgi:hypothetical protein